MNISSLHFDLFSIIAIAVNQIGNNVVCVVARLFFFFCCALTTVRCNAFQHIFVNWKKSEFYGPYSQTMLFLVTMGKMILFYWKYSNTTHITISNYFELNYKLIMFCRDFTNWLIVTFVIWKQVLVNMAALWNQFWSLV